VSVLTAYQRFRFLWGAVDWEGGSDSPYTGAQTGANLGTSAAAGVGVGVRRVVLVFDRTTAVTGSDAAECHFDFLNYTAGSPDDSWITSDYTTLEGYLDTWWTAVKPRINSQIKLIAYRWYRHGPGINPPNPAERVTTRSVAGTGTGNMLPPQDAFSITFRTAVRRSWGRTYLPGLNMDQVTAPGKWGSTGVDAVVNATGALLSSAIGSDFPLVVVSNHLSAVLNVESVSADDLADVIRRRRWKQATYHKILP
jgi:hypothetical protein